MGEWQPERDYEENRLTQTLNLAGKQLKAAKEAAEGIRSEIMEAKEEMWEDAPHGITNLSSMEDFEAIVELSQYQSAVINQIADYEGKERQIRLLQRIMESPYFARIDFAFDGEDEAEKIYIGRHLLKKENAQEIAVYDWRSPVAGVFYRFMTGKAFYDAPCGRITGEVTKKRQYEIKNGTLEYFFDADVEIVDEVLRQLLSQNATAKMKSVVETIQREQDVVIRDMENDLLMVQGVAGSGKTSIALHRAAYLMYQGLQNKLAANNILIVSPNMAFEQYISDVLPELGEEQAESMVFDDLLRAVIKDKKIQPRNEFLENLLCRPKNAEIMKKSIRFKTSEQFRRVLDRFVSEIPGRWMKLDDVFYEGKRIAAAGVLKQKLSEAAARGSGREPVRLGVRLEQLETYVLECAFGSGKQRGIRAEKSVVRQELRSMLKLDIPALYSSLFQEEAWDMSGRASEEETCGLSEQELQEIRAYTLRNLGSGRLAYDDAIAAAYLYLKIYGAEGYRNIRQVVIDEAQDYYPLQYRIFGLLFPNAKFTVLGDLHQTIEKCEEFSFYERTAGILNQKTSSLITLHKSFRCTNEILKFSLRFLPEGEAAGEHSEIESFNRSGDEVTVMTADSTRALTERIAEEIALCRRRGFGSIGLICRTEANAAGLYQKLKSMTDIRLVRAGSMLELQGAFLIPVYMAKGLEFDAVILCDADSLNYCDDDDKSLLYVACTRALHRLSVFGEKEISPLID